MIVTGKPDWLKIRPPTEKYAELKQVLRAHGLVTVCEESHCPNMSECWSSGTATFMAMGETCTRGCRFCQITHGKAKTLDSQEPKKIAQTAKEMGLSYVVMTSVARDDLPDQGAAHIAACITAVKEEGLIAEFLIPDLQGKEELLDMILKSSPHVLAHNIETVRRLTPTVRDRRAHYDQSLAVLAYIKKKNSQILTKSSIMIGLGETEEEVIQTLKDLRAAGVDIITVGQYLQPGKMQLAVRSYVHPDQFKKYEQIAKELGFRFAVAGPFVRSSYKAAEAFVQHTIGGIA